MSATTRTKAEIGNDYYRTPTWCVDAIRDYIPNVAEVCDPCAGDGAILDAFYEDSAVEPPPLRALEIDPVLAAKIRPEVTTTVRDALSPEPWGARGNVVMNPPYSQAEAFVRRALAEVEPHGGCVFALLRLGFLESAERVDLHAEYPSHVYPLSVRPSFCLSVRCRDRRGCGYRAQLPTHGDSGQRATRPKKCPACGGPVATSTTDATAYAWFAWGTRPGMVRPGVTVMRIEQLRHTRAPSSDHRIDVGAGVIVPVPSEVGDRRIERDEAQLVAKVVLDLNPALFEHLHIRRACGALGADLSRIYRARLRALSEEVLAASAVVHAPKAAKKAKRRSA